MKNTVLNKQAVNVKHAVLLDLKNINEAVQRELVAWRESCASTQQIRKKLLFLFQCDLLPGISGKILELKASRDASEVKHVSLWSKVLGYSFLFLMDVGMLFYILLFALTQTGPRQNAWFQSFALWLVVEILFVSTAIVFITHILVPSLIMKDLSQIKRRLMDNIRDFNDKVNSATGTDKSAIDAEESGFSFNAANFLFVSTRLARQFPDLKESKIIAQFSTPWPRQSYLHVQNVSKKYSKKFSAFTRSASILLIFFVGNFLSVPPACQDIIVQMTSTTAIGYLVLIHVQLFEIFPALVILPALVLVVVAHFVIQSSKSDAKIRLARLLPVRRSEDTADEVQLPPPSDDPTEKISPSHSYDSGSSSGEEFNLSEEDEEQDDDVFNSATTAVSVQVHGSSGPSHPSSHQSRRQSIQAGLGLLHTLATTADCQQEHKDCEQGKIETYTHGINTEDVSVCRSSTSGSCGKLSLHSSQSISDFSSASSSHSIPPVVETVEEGKVSTVAPVIMSAPSPDSADIDDDLNVVYSDIDSDSDSTSSYNISEMSAEDLHLPVGTPVSSPRTLIRNSSIGRKLPSSNQHHTVESVSSDCSVSVSSESLSGTECT